MSDTFLDSVPTVRVGPDSEKFIVARVFNKKNEGKLVIRAAKSTPYTRRNHLEILETLKAEILPLGLTVQCDNLDGYGVGGGGRCRINDEQKEILLWHESGDFGKENDRATTVRMLQEAFPGYTVLSLSFGEALARDLPMGFPF